MHFEPLHPIQLQRFREMTPEEKWNVALGLLETARETRRAALRQRHLEWTPEQIETALARETMHART